MLPGGLDRDGQGHEDQCQDGHRRYIPQYGQVALHGNRGNDEGRTDDGQMSASSPCRHPWNEVHERGHEVAHENHVAYAGAVAIDKEHHVQDGPGEAAGAVREEARVGVVPGRPGHAHEQRSAEEGQKATRHDHDGAQDEAAEPQDVAHRQHPAAQGGAGERQRAVPEAVQRQWPQAPHQDRGPSPGGAVHHRFSIAGTRGLCPRG
mmetsp:Transcript_29784/g.67470  ORF Transcript_29784/g.67470 Transcript_29784/m.67470 type:complete len:206 (-) Transcript_29784:59-676(-)